MAPPQRPLVEHLVGWSTQIDGPSHLDRLEQRGARSCGPGDPVPGPFLRQLRHPGAGGLGTGCQPPGVHAGGGHRSVERRVGRGAAPVVAKDRHQVCRSSCSGGPGLGVRLTDPARGDPRLQEVVVVGKAGDGETVRDAASSQTDALHLPQPAGCFQHVRLADVGDQETVVVGEGSPLVSASSALAKLAEERHDHVDGRFRGGRPLQGQAEQVHAGQSGGGIGLTGEDGLVADGHTELVGAHLRTPHPVGAAHQHRVGLGDLRDLDPGAPDGGSRLVTAALVPFQQLGFVGVPIGVLGEEQPGGFDHHHRVTHGCDTRRSPPPPGVRSRPPARRRESSPGHRAGVPPRDRHGLPVESGRR